MRVRIASILAGAALLPLLAAPAALATTPDVWTQWGVSPTSAQDSWMRSFDFSASGAVYASSDGGGVFAAASGYGPWTQAVGGLTDDYSDLSVYQLIASGSDLYAATSGGLFKAAQGADPSWSQLGGGTGDNKLNMGGIESVAVEPGNTLVVAVAGAADPGVYTSSDGGSFWTRASGMPEVENVWDLAQGPGSLIYAAGESGAWTSTDGGNSWSLTADGIDTADTTLRVAVTPGNPSQLWASASGNIYESTDGGASWQNAGGVVGTALPDDQPKYALAPVPLGGSASVSRMLVGTDDGVWATVDGGQAWGQMSTSVAGPGGLDMGNEIVWSLGFAPSGADLLAGSQANGVFALPLTPVAAPSSETLSPSSGLEPGTTLTPGGSWFGTGPLVFTYKWQTCPGTNCSNWTNVPTQNGGNGSTYTIQGSDGGTQTRYRVQVCAINLVSPAPVCIYSSPTSGTTPIGAVPGTAPVPLGNINKYTSLSSNPANGVSWGTVFIINAGKWGTENQSDKQITPSAYAYEWQRCDDQGDCSVIVGATHGSYTTTVADVGDSLTAYVRAYNGAASSDWYLVDNTTTIEEQTPVNIVAPKIVGAPYVGQTLQSSAGAWTGHDPTYTREWLQCASDGLDCAPYNPDQTGNTYTITSGDLGDVLELAVTATQPDPSQDRVTLATSAPTAVITNPPPPPPGGGNGGKNGSGAKATGPRIRISGPKHLRAGSRLIGTASVAGYKKISYQWLRDGKAIKHATHGTYKLSRHDLGQRISLRVTLRTASGRKTVLTSNTLTVPRARHRRRR